MAVWECFFFFFLIKLKYRLKKRNCLVLNLFNINKTQTKQYEQTKYTEREQRFHIQWDATRNTTRLLPLSNDWNWKVKKDCPNFPLLDFYFGLEFVNECIWVKVLPRNNEFSFAKTLFGCRPMWSCSFLLLLLLLLISISFSEFFFFFWSFVYYFLLILVSFLFLQIFVSAGLGVNVNFLGWRIFQIGLSVACKLFDFCWHHILQPTFNLTWRVKG